MISIVVFKTLLYNVYNVMMIIITKMKFVIKDNIKIFSVCNIIYMKINVYNVKVIIFFQQIKKLANLFLMEFFSVWIIKIIKHVNFVIRGIFCKKINVLN